MGTKNGSEHKPLWLEIEEGILGLADADLEESSREKTVQKIAAMLDEKGFNTSRTGGHLLQLRWALDARRDIGRPLLHDLNKAIGALTLEDVSSPPAATTRIIRELGESWSILRGGDQIQDVGHIVASTKLKLLIGKAKTMEGDGGVRYLREQAVADLSIIEGMGITQEKLAEVDAAIAAEKAEIARVRELLATVSDKPEQDRIKHLLNSDVSEELILSIAEVDRSALDATKVAMEEETKEKLRLAEEAAAKKRAEAEGPSLEDLSAEDMLEHIEALREILDFSDQEKEIRVMCEQSGIPKALADIAVSDPDKLDEMEEKAEAES
jgi:hypothetical protein